MTYKSILAILIFTIIFANNLMAQVNTKTETLTNYSILNMVKKGIGPKIIIMKIKNSITNFDQSTDALIYLKDAKVSDEIIMAMLEKNEVKEEDNNDNSNNTKQNKTSEASNNNQNNTKSNNTPVVNNNNNNKNNKEKELTPEAQEIINNLNGSGIYYFDEDTKAYTQLDPTVVSGAQSKLNAGSYFGIGGAAVSKSFVDGKEANLQITNTRKPIFYFYFDNAKTSLNNSNNKAGQQPENYVDKLYGYNNQMNSKAFTPNDFKVIKFDIKQKSRYFKGGKSGFTGNTSRITSKYFETFKYERVSQNLFKVYFIDDLSKAAEYSFLYAGNASNNDGSNGNNKSEIKVFDFGTSWKKK
jgi:hypothetical protein